MGMVTKSGWKSHHRSLSLADRAIWAPYNDRLQTNIKDTLAVLYHLKVQKSEKTFHGCPLNYHEVRPDLSNHWKGQLVWSEQSESFKTPRDKNRHFFIF